MTLAAGRAIRLGVLALAGTLVCALVPADGAWAGGQSSAKIERPVRSAAPDASIVRESLVRLRAPLPESVGPHPAACDWIEYLRFRHREGPSRAPRADMIYVLMPGFLGGASSFDQVARNTIRHQARRGQHVEFWALDRRSNCLEDDRGIRAADRTGDPSIAYDYYWDGAEVGGQTFDGFVPPMEAAWLGEVGIPQTMRDWYTVLRRGIPGQRRRERKVVCGGHSLGGPLTALFSSWDFDGDPETTRDAGYRQCAGLFGLDTTLELSGTGGGAPVLPAILNLLAQSGAAPYINAPPLTPETIQLPSVFGVGSFHKPNGLDLLSELPNTPNVEVGIRGLYSRDAVHFATQEPSIRDFTIFNRGVLGGLFDDNSVPKPLTFLRASVGIIRGGPLTDKNFPQPDPTVALPEDETKSYRWVGFRRTGPEDVPLNDEGQQYTNRQSEVSDLRQFARTMFEAPANFVEQYFPTRILLDLTAVESGAFEQLAHDGPSQRAILLVQAADSDDNTEPDSGPAFAGTKPNERRASRELIVPGYNHLDVATAAWRQNGGRREETSAALAAFGRRVVR